jgi:hypothetical protein
MFMQYGLPMEHQTEEASSRFIAPVSLFHCHERRAIDKHIRCRSSITWSDCLILQSRIRRSVLHGRITTKGRIEYQFKTFSGYNNTCGSEAGNENSRRVLECDRKSLLKVTVRRSWDCAIIPDVVNHTACAWSNAQDGIVMPTFGILCYALSFEIYRFDSSSDPCGFLLGSFPAAPRYFRSPVCASMDFLNRSYEVCAWLPRLFST